MTFKVLDSISVRRLNDLFWGYFRPFFTYILDNKVRKRILIRVLMGEAIACRCFAE